MYAAVVASTDQLKVSFNGTFSASYYCSYNSNLNGLGVEYNTLAINNILPLTPTPGVGETLQLQALSICNSVSSSMLTIQILYINSGNYILYQIDLTAGYTLTYTADGAGFQVYDTNGVRQ
jgi:hypothetical protein